MTYETESNCKFIFGGNTKILILVGCKLFCGYFGVFFGIAINRKFAAAEKVVLTNASHKNDAHILSGKTHISAPLFQLPAAIFSTQE
jgi:hypothetical protein